MYDADKIAIFRTVFPVGSETFIRDQIASMVDCLPVVVAREQTAPYAKHAVITPKSSLHAKLWTLTRWPRLFPLESLEDVRLMHAHFGQDAVMSLPLAERLGIPLVTTFHGADITTDRRRFATSRKPTQRWFARKEGDLIRGGAAFVAVSRFIEKKLLDLGYPPSRVHQIYIGVDTDRFFPRHDPRPDQKYILCVARHAPKKGIETLLRAGSEVALRHPDVELWQVGGGGITQYYVDLAKELGVTERVKFLGALPHQQVLGLMQGARAFVLPSQTAEDGDSEALGIVFNEASACGIPVISTWHGGIPEAVLDQETGLLSPERDYKALANNMEWILSDPSFGQNLGKRGRQYVCESFDLKKQTPKLESLYRSVIEAGVS